MPERFVLTCIALPGIGLCTALQKLILRGCVKLQSLPESESCMGISLIVVLRDGI